MRHIRKTSSIIAAAMAFMLLTAGIAGAVSTPSPRGGPIDCRASATKVGEEITITFWLHTTRPHRYWRLRIWDNDLRVYAKTRLTDRAGDFRVRVSTVNQRGQDVLRFRAANRPSDSTCTVGNLRV